MRAQRLKIKRVCLIVCQCLIVPFNTDIYSKRNFDDSANKKAFICYQISISTADMHLYIESEIPYRQRQTRYPKDKTSLKHLEILLK